MSEALRNILASGIRTLMNQCTREISIGGGDLVSGRVGGNVKWKTDADAVQSDTEDEIRIAVSPFFTLSGQLEWLESVKNEETITRVSSSSATECAF